MATRAQRIDRRTFNRIFERLIGEGVPEDKARQRAMERALNRANTRIAEGSVGQETGSFDTSALRVDNQDRRAGNRIFNRSFQRALQANPEGSPDRIRQRAMQRTDDRLGSGLGTGGSDPDVPDTPIVPDDPTPPAFPGGSGGGGGGGGGGSPFQTGQPGGGAGGGAGGAGGGAGAGDFEFVDVNPIPTADPVQFRRLDPAAEARLDALQPNALRDFEASGATSSAERLQNLEFQRLSPEAEATLQEMDPQTRQRFEELLGEFSDPTSDDPLNQQFRQQLQNLLELGPEANMDRALERLKNTRERLIPLREAASRRATQNLQRLGLLDSPEIVASTLGEIETEIQNRLIQEFRTLANDEAQRAQDRFLVGLGEAGDLASEDRQFEVARRELSTRQAATEAQEALDIESLREQGRQRRTDELARLNELDLSREQAAGGLLAEADRLGLDRAAAEDNFQLNTERLREAARQRRTDENLGLGGLELEARRVANEGKAIDGNLLLENQAQRLAYQEFLFNAGMSQAEFQLAVERARQGQVTGLLSILTGLLNSLQRGFI